MTWRPTLEDNESYGPLRPRGHLRLRGAGGSPITDVIGMQSSFTYGPGDLNGTDHAVRDHALRGWTTGAAAGSRRRTPWGARRGSSTSTRQRLGNRRPRCGCTGHGGPCRAAHGVTRRRARTLATATPSTGQASHGSCSWQLHGGEARPLAPRGGSHDDSWGGRERKEAPREHEDLLQVRGPGVRLRRGLAGHPPRVVGKVRDDGTSQISRTSTTHEARRRRRSTPSGGRPSTSMATTTRRTPTRRLARGWTCCR